MERKPCDVDLAGQGVEQPPDGTRGPTPMVSPRPTSSTPRSNVAVVTFTTCESGTSP